VVEAVKSDFHRATLSEPDRALLRYAETLTLRSSEVTEAKVQALRDAGLADEDIHDAAQIVAYFNYINRVCDGLGCKSEPEAN